MLWTFQNPEKCNDFRSLFKHLFKKNYFVIDFVCLIASWLEIGNEKKCYFQCNLNIHILSQFSITLEKDFEKGL
jgi:Fe-S oxidoreductase